MGALTDSLHQLERTATIKETKKEREKREKKEIEMELYKFFNYHFSQFPKNYELNYKYYLKSKPRQELHKNFANQLDFIEFYKIYDNILNYIYKRYKKIYNTNEEEKQEKEYYKKLEEIQKLDNKYYLLLEQEKELKQERQKKKSNHINNIIATSLLGGIIAASKHKNKYRKGSKK